MTRQIRRMDDLLVIGSAAAFKIRDIDGTAIDGTGTIEEVLTSGAVIRLSDSEQYARIGFEELV